MLQEARWPEYREEGICTGSAETTAANCSGLHTEVLEDKELLFYAVIEVFT